MTCWPLPTNIVITARIFQVGEFSTDVPPDTATSGIASGSQKVLYLKLLKAPLKDQPAYLEPDDEECVRFEDGRRQLSVKYFVYRLSVQYII